MNRLARYIIISVIVAIILFTVWYFQSIVAYILISAVVTLIGKPIVDILGKIQIKKFQLNKTSRALMTLVVLWIFLVAFISNFIPMIASEANELSKINLSPLLSQIHEPLEELNKLIYSFYPNEEGITLEELVRQKLKEVLNISLFSNIIGSLGGLLGNIFIAAFSISFISFFLLKEDRLFYEGIMAFVPTKQEFSVSKALIQVRKLLMRYFVGILAQISMIIILVTVGLMILGIDFQRCLVIGLFTGVFNIIPYVGPLIGASFGIIIGSATFIEMDFSIFVNKLIYISIVFIIIQLLDNFVFQPLIYGNSVNAHPLEIFLVILIAGSIAGIPGMILAIPVYTIFRVFAREFFSQFKVIQKLTERMPETTVS